MNTTPSPIDTDELKKHVTEPGIWIRLLSMLVLGLGFYIGSLILGAVTVIQFFTRLLTGAPIAGLADFGGVLADWMAAAVRFLTFRADERPFPFGPPPPSATAVTTTETVE